MINLILTIYQINHEAMFPLLCETLIMTLEFIPNFSLRKNKNIFSHTRKFNQIAKFHKFSHAYPIALVVFITRKYK